MIDQEIRDYLSRDLDEHDLFKAKHRDVRPLLKELLAHRSLKFTGWWRVWCPDHGLSGWRAVAAFPDRDEAIAYRTATVIPDSGALVLPWNEEPYLTAR